MDIECYEDEKNTHTAYAVGFLTESTRFSKAYSRRLYGLKNRRGREAESAFNAFKPWS